MGDENLGVDVKGVNSNVAGPSAISALVPNDVVGDQDLSFREVTVDGLGAEALL